MVGTRVIRSKPTRFRDYDDLFEFDRDKFRAVVWNQALDIAEDDSSVTLISEWYDADPVAVAAYRVGEMTKLISLSSYRPGSGSKLVARIPCPFWCKGVDSAEGFYLKMGMIPLCPIEVRGRPAKVYVKL